MGKSTSRASVYVGIDLGGTSIQTAVVRKGRVKGESKKKTRPDEGVDAVIGRIVDSVREALDDAGDGFRPRAVCIGAPGAVERASGVVLTAPNLGWTQVPLGETLGRALDLPVFVDNDVNCGVVGEHVHGAAEGALDAAAVFVGTGVGGALIVNGQLIDGFRGAAGELGHMIVRPQGRECPCGLHGCVEAYASKTAMDAMIREAAEQGRRSRVPEIMRDKGKDRMTSSVIASALDEGDEVMTEVLGIAQFHLGLLTANVVNVFDPEVVVYGGGIVERLGSDFVDAVARVARENFFQRDDDGRVRLLPAALGDHAGTVGAAVIARRRFGAS